MGKKLSPYGRKEWHRKHSGNKTVSKSIDAAFRGAGAVGRAASKVPSSKGFNIPAKFVIISLAIGCLGFFLGSAYFGLGMSCVCGIAAFWSSLSIFSIIYGTAKGIKDGYEQGKSSNDFEDEDEQLYSPNPEWMGQIDIVNSRQNARILAPQFLKQAQESAKILQTTTDPSTFFTRYDFCIGRLLGLEKCKGYGVPVSTSADLKKYRSLAFRDEAINEIIHRTEEKYQTKIESLKTPKAKKNWAEKYHQAFEPYLPYMSDKQKTVLGEVSAELFALAEGDTLENE